MTIPGGYLLLSRKLIESEIFDKPPLYIKVWVYLLSKAQHKDYKKLDRGQLFTSISEIQEACSWYVGYRKETPSKSKIYRIVDWLRKTGERAHERDTNDKMIETTKATQGMVVTILNYGYYQDPNNYDRNGDQNNERTPNVTRPKHYRNNINKNVNNVKNEKNVNNKPSEESDIKSDEFSLTKKDNGRYDYPEDYERLYSLYPYSRGNKKAGWRKWAATRRKNVNQKDLLTAVKNYAANCKKNGTAEKWVMHIKKFFGPDEYWKEYLGGNDNGKNKISGKNRGTSEGNIGEEVEAMFNS